MKPSPSKSVAIVALLVTCLVGCRSYPWSPKTATAPDSALSADRNVEGFPAATMQFGQSSNKTQTKSKSKQKVEDVEYTQSLSAGRSLEKANKLDEARKVYEDLIARFPDRYQAYHRLAVVCDRQKRFREAEALYTQAIRLNPTNPELFNDLGYCYLIQGQYQKAERALIKAIGIAPANDRYRNNLGLAYGFQGRYEEAMEQFRRGGGVAEAWYNLAYVQFGRNDVAAARESLYRALAVDAQYTPAREALARMEHGEGFSPSEQPLPGGRWVNYEAPQETAASEVIAEDSVPPRNLRLGLRERPSTQTQLDVARSSWTNRINQAAQQDGPIP